MNVTTASSAEGKASSRAPAPRGRPRDEASDARIMAAARELLAERGVDAMTFEAIAQRAGATRPAIYRRWPSKAHLLSEIANGMGGPIPPIPPATPVETALRALVERVFDHYSKAEVRAANIGLIAAYQHKPELRQELQIEIEEAARRELADIFAHAEANGSLRSGVDSDVVFDLLVGAVAFRTMFSSVELPNSITDELLKVVMAAIHPD